MKSRETAVIGCLLATALAIVIAGCSETPSPPITPAGVNLPPEVEGSPEQAHAQYHSTQQ